MRPHIHTYPEEKAGVLEDARQASRWCSEVDANVAAPMARAEREKDYFIHAPCMAFLNSSQFDVVMPIRWFKRDGEMWAKVHRLLRTRANDGYVVDTRPGQTLC